MKNGLIAFSLMALISCSPRIVTYTNSKARFAKFSTYRIVNAKIGKRKLAPEATQLLGEIESQIKLEMEERRNYLPSSTGPDLILRYELVSNANADRNNNNNSPFNSPFNAPSFNSRVVYESVILIELLNNKQLVWQGSYDLNQSKREAKNETAVKKAISLIFTTYPYKAGEAKPDDTLTTKKKK